MSLCERKDYCRECKKKMETKKCNAKRYIGKTANNTITAHYGEHDCHPSNVKPKEALSQTDHDYLSTQFAYNSQLTSAVAVSNLIGRTVLSEGFGAAVAQAESVERAKIRRIKSQSRTQSALNNVRELKAKMDSEDDCLIHDIADGSVVTSSTLRVQFAANMCQTDSLLSECPLFIEEQVETLGSVYLIPSLETSMKPPWWRVHIT